MVRKALVCDIPNIVKLGRDFLSMTALSDIAPFDDASATKLVTGMIEGAGIALVLETDHKVVGFIIGTVIPMYWNTNILFGQQIALFVHPDSRGSHSLKLVDAFEKECCSLGATVISSGAKKDKRYEGMNKMLLRRGYSEIESVYIKGV